MNTATLFYRDKPTFGLDIGFSSLKIMQIDREKGRNQVVGYGVMPFDSASVVEGVINHPENIAKAVKELFNQHLVGDITTDRVVMAAPASRTFTRTFTLPLIEPKDMPSAIQTETEQYVPVPLEELYTDYRIISKTDKEMEVLLVAIPKKIIDSYLELVKIMGLELVAVETTLNATSRLFVNAEQSDVPSVLIDLGSLSSDITIFDKTLIVTGTAPGGGDSFTQAIAQGLGVNKDESNVIKTKYGLGMSKRQDDVKKALDPILNQIIKEIRRMIRYYEERSSTNQKISQVVTMGGGANMPGLSELLTDIIRLPVRMCEPWQHLDFHRIQAPNTVEKSLYVTAAGLALIQPGEIFT